MSLTNKIHSKRPGFLLFLLPLFFLSGPSIVWSKSVSCAKFYDRGIPKVQAPRTLPPKDFKFVVWRYNSGLLDSDGNTNFGNAQIAELVYNAETRSYSLLKTNQMVDNTLQESPENVYRRVDGGLMAYRPDVIASEMASGSQGDGIFERNQSFTFDTYEKHGYLSAEETKFQREIARKKVLPEQVTFIEGLEKRSKNSLKREFGEIPKNARREPESTAWQHQQAYFSNFKSPRNPLYDLKVGAAWVIAGQANGRKLPLALEAEKMVNPISRDLYPFIFEFGRAAQIYPFAHDEAIHAGLFYIVNEVLAAGGRLDDAYVFAHAMDAKRSAVNRRKHRMKEFSRYQDPARGEESVLVTPLLELLKLYKIENFSSTVKSAQKALADLNANENVNGVDIYKEVFDSRRMAKRELLIQTGQNAVPSVQVRDFSNLRSALSYSRNKTRASVIEHESPPQEDRDNIVRILEREQKSAHEATYTRLQGIRENHPQYQYDSFQNLNSFLYKENAIEIYAGDTTLTPSELAVAVYKNYVKYLKNAGITDPNSFLHNHDVHFAITKSGKPVDVTGISASGRWFIYRPPVDLIYNMGFSGFGSQRVKHVPAVYWESVSFSVDQVAKLAQNPEYRHIEASEARGTQILHDPRLFAP